MPKKYHKIPIQKPTSNVTTRKNFFEKFFENAKNAAHLKRDVPLKYFSYFKNQ